LFVALLVIASLLMTAMPTAADSGVTRFSGCTETYVATLDPGTQIPLPNGSVIIKGQVMMLRDDCPTEPRESGDNTVVMNAILDAAGLGPMWGTAVKVSDEGGVWEIQWVGALDAQGARIEGSGQGIGLYAELRMWVTSLYGTFSGIIVERGR
jgi:hypothetical protein